MLERFDHHNKCFKTIIGLKREKIKIGSILKKGEVDESFEQELGLATDPKNVDDVKEMNWPKFLIDKLLARIKKTLTQSRSSILYLKHFSLVGERVVPTEKRGDEVDVVDAMGWPDYLSMDASYVHKRFEYFDNSLSEVKEDIMGVRDAIDVLARSVKSSQKSIGEAIARLLNKSIDVIIERDVEKRHA
ncbi:hypothetical protein M9H77_18536 [Catharanthus roseus]|uniref:Uncharacterized protein n=1 Tax=Catharanthus roseus TaxID=4058 RepID=A0ACC0B820_CATRO|nr:hypothetical protein M9H77_18536 [Catharanthus roseus]